MSPKFEWNWWNFLFAATSQDLDISFELSPVTITRWHIKYSYFELSFDTKYIFDHNLGPSYDWSHSERWIQLRLCSTHRRWYLIYPKAVSFLFSWWPREISKFYFFSGNYGASGMKAFLDLSEQVLYLIRKWYNCVNGILNYRRESAQRLNWLCPNMSISIQIQSSIKLF